MEVKSFAILLLSLGACLGQQPQQQQQQLQPEFRNLQEPQFTPPLPLNNNENNLFNNQPLQQFNTNQQQNQFQARQLQQQQPQLQQQPQQSFQQNNFQAQPQPQQQQPQQNFADFSNFRGNQETLPTLPPVFIPPNNPIGPAPSLQSPIRNLFRQPQSDNSFSISNIISRFLNLFNLNSN